MKMNIGYIKITNKRQERNFHRNMKFMGTVSLKYLGCEMYRVRVMANFHQKKLKFYYFTKQCLTYPIYSKLS